MFSNIPGLSESSGLKTELYDPHDNLVNNEIASCKKVDKNQIVIEIAGPDGNGVEIGGNLFLKITHKGSVFGRSKLCLFGLNTLFAQ